jgi:hypothetical protein
MLPYSAYRSLAQEREEKTWPLLVLTGMSPRKVLSGKISSSALQAVLYASVIAPFFFFAYLLQGISLLLIGTLLLTALCFHLFLTVAAVTAATLGESRVVRGAIHFGVLGALFLCTISAFSYAATMVTMHNASDLEAMLVIAGVGSWLMLLYGLVLFAVAVARVTFESDNTALWPRLGLLLHFGGCALICYGVVLSGYRTDDLGLMLGVVGACHAFLAGLFSATVRPGVSKRLLKDPPRITLLGLLMPGAARGLRFSVLLVGLFAGAGAGLVILEGRSDTMPHLGAVATAGAFAVLYVALPVALGRGPLRRWMWAPAFLQVLGALLLIGALGIPPLAALVADLPVDHEGLNYLNPIVAIGHQLDGANFEKAAILWVFALTAYYVAHRLSTRQDREACDG